MTRNDKITEVLSLINVPPGEAMVARRNYERLTEAEIDERLERLRASARAIEEWRRHHHLVRAAAPATAADRGHVEAFSPQVEEFVPQAAARAVVPGSTRQPIANRRDQKFAGVFGPHELAWLFEYMPLYSEQSEGPVRLEDRPGWDFLHEHPLLTTRASPQLTPGELVDALARLANVAKKYPPDVIVGLNEGRWIAQALKSYLGLSSLLMNLTGSADTDLDWSAIRPNQRGKVVCVIGHVARTGLTLSEAIAKSREIFETERVFGMVLAASASAAKYFSNAPNVRYHQIIGTLDHHSSVSFRKTPMALASTRALIASSQKLMMKRYPIDPMPWEQHRVPRHRIDAR